LITWDPPKGKFGKIIIFKYAGNQGDMLISWRVVGFLVGQNFGWKNATGGTLVGPNFGWKMPLEEPTFFRST